ncbi:DUF1826 domain-containing protein [Pseudomonas sp. LJDD11]|uniref:DUF1826 domain-containing protein n=1 Tax=Pseudomonas sp. LJDD11 TaxID=2931984 RepID=UPI00211C10E8|nr:DUF1826 domain-containing protein [Pseudomonas sp. LJDD11]MCQ9423721.1 DUF1826 domain-containing protein [Pseudomonas sp. LJDD11]
MLAQVLTFRPLVRQVQGDNPDILGEVLQDGVNLAVWQRHLPLHIQDFASALLTLNEPLSESLALEVKGGDLEPDLQRLAAAYADVQGHAGFVADVSWLVSAYACLLGAERVGLRLRAMDTAMCPRFHVDHVPMRLITTYAGIGSQWLKERDMDRSRLGQAQAEPKDPALIQQIQCGAVALLKGERWIGNEGHGLIHRSPPLSRNERRLILTLDWLA